MGNKQIRTGQLIAPFGPGSLYTDRTGTPQVVCGLDHWFKKWDQTHGLVNCEDRTEFERSDQRLSALLHVDRFCTPPDYRRSAPNTPPPPNAFLNVPAQRFPCWYRHTATGELRRFNLETNRIDRPQGGGRWQPVRFVAICASGHLCEFPWKEWIGCQCTSNEGLRLTDRGGSELSSIRVACETCPAGSTGHRGKSLAGTTTKPTPGDPPPGDQSKFQQAGITCTGDRPWLGQGANENQCNSPLIGALINQTNLYFPRTIAAIGLPDLRSQSESVARLRGELDANPMIGIARSVWNIGQQRKWEVENPPAQKFTKTDLAKYEHAWLGLPHFVCLGAEKNFNKLAERMEEDGEPLVDVNYFQHLVAKGILFRSTEKIFTSLDLTGFRANSVAYAVALLSERSKLRIDLNRIWAEQRLSPSLVEALKTACTGAHQYISGAEGNPGEQSKKPEFWDVFRLSDLELPDTWEKEWAESCFVAPTSEEDALSAEWERVRVRLLNDNRTIQALEAYTNREWIPKYRRASVATLAAHDWKSLKRKPGIGLKKLRVLVEMFAIAVADL